jgi:hypothetical protein
MAPRSPRWSTVIDADLPAIMNKSVNSAYRFLSKRRDEARVLATSASILKPDKMSDLSSTISFLLQLRL